MREHGNALLRNLNHGALILRTEGFRSLIKRLFRVTRARLGSTNLCTDDLLKTGSQYATITELNGNKYEVIFFSIINWEFRYQRPQHIATRFANNGHRVFYISVDLRRQNSYVIRQLSDNVYEITLPFTENAAIYNAAIDKGFDTLTLALDSLFKDFRIQESIAFVEFPLWYPLVKYLKDSHNTKVIFDCLDDFSGFRGVRKDIDEVEKLLLESSHFCITTSRKLYEQHKNECDNIAIVGNATEFRHFNDPPANDLLKDIKKPIIGYYGAIAEWFDTETVEYIASQRPEWSIVLIGHSFGSDMHRLKKFKNIHLLGEKPYAELPKYLYWFHVCIIPFKLIELILSTNPVKFYEFISSGKPVVSARLPELLPFSDLVYLAHDKEEFLKNIDVALKEDDDDLVRRRIGFAKANDWDGRYQEINEYIKSTFPLVSIIIVTFNNFTYTKLCIESIYARTAYPKFEVIIVDNASTDGTREYLEELEGKRRNVKVILNQENQGFAAASNIGIKISKGEFVILLNNDTIVTRGWISGLIKHLIKNPQVGMVGPVTNAIGNEAKINVPYSDISDIELFADNYTSRNRGIVFEIPVLALFCVAMRRDIIERVGLLDEQFSVGMFEDDDYAMRMKQAGLKTVCTEDVFIHHFGRASFGKLKSQEYQRIFTENKRKYEDKWAMTWVPHRYRDGVM